MLSDLYAAALADARAREIETSVAGLEALIAERLAPLDALQALQPAENVRVIAEIKRGAPVAGEIAEIADPQTIAQQFEAGGASVISVATQAQHYRGSLADLIQVRKAVSIPVLCKDFIATEYQLLEARAFGADMVSLLVAGLEQPLLQRLYDFAAQLQLGVLVETHSSEEVSRAVDLGAEIIGVSARNLETLEVDSDLFGKVADLIPAGIIRVAAGAVHSVLDVMHYREAGADAVVTGQALLRDSDPASVVASFVSVV